MVQIGDITRQLVSNHSLSSLSEGQFALGFASSRDLTLAAGTQVITGVGFRPSLIFFQGSAATTSVGACWGGVYAGSQADAQMVTSDNNLETVDTHQNNSQRVLRSKGTGASGENSAQITAISDDGFTLTWFHSGSPTGTLNFHFICVKL